MFSQINGRELKYICPWFLIDLHKDHISDWIEAPEWYEPGEVGLTEFYPPIKPCDPHHLIIDDRVSKGELQVRTFLNKDHTDICLLPDGCPASVRSFFKRGMLLRVARNVNVYPIIKEFKTAYLAWDNFRIAGGENTHPTERDDTWMGIEEWRRRMAERET